MNQTDQLIKVGMAYNDAILNLKEGHPEEVSKILIILDSVCLDSDYHFGIYIEEICHERRITNQCEQSWFHCYQGKEEPIMRRPYNYWKWDDDGNMNMLFLRKTFGIFKHISVKATPMGAWQAYLLCISKAILPFSGTLYYTKRKLIFTDKQLKDLASSLGEEEAPGLSSLNVDVSPTVTINGKNAIITCCYWTEWGGLIRDEAKLTFYNNGKVKIGNIDTYTLYEYDIGVRF